MTRDTSIEEKVREELERMWAEVGTAHLAPDRVVARARRATAVGVAGVVLAVAVVIGGSVVAWSAFGPSGPRGSVPAARGPIASTAPGPTGGPSGLDAALLARPVALPSMLPGATCPTTPMTTISPGTGTGFSGSAPAQSSGHVYLAFNARRVTLAPSDLGSDGWYGIKDVWAVDPSYSGPVLIRGGRLDGGGSMELGWNLGAPMQDAIQIDRSSPSLQSDLATGWRSVPMVAYVRSPGCYAYQLDGTVFTEFIVFEASR